MFSREVHSHTIPVRVLRFGGDIFFPTSLGGGFVEKPQRYLFFLGNGQVWFGGFQVDGNKRRNGWNFQE